MTPKFITVKLVLAWRNRAKSHKITIAKTGTVTSEPCLVIRIDKT